MEDPTLPAQPSLSRAPAVPSWGCTWGLALGLTAGWLAAGSCGVFVASLQALLVWLLLIAVALLVRPQLQLTGSGGDGSSLALLLLTPRVTGWSPVHLPLVVVATLGLMSAGHRGANRRLLLLGGLAVLTLTLFRFAQLQIPLAWVASEWLGKQLGHAAGILTGQPLTIGATFAGLDLLVAMTVLWIGLLTSTRAPRGAVALFAAACILLAHTVYLTALAFTPQIL